MESSESPPRLTDTTKLPQTSERRASVSEITALRVEVDDARRNIVRIDRRRKFDAHQRSDITQRDLACVDSESSCPPTS
jgi:hypothetical protein